MPRAVGRIAEKLLEPVQHHTSTIAGPAASNQTPAVGAGAGRITQSPSTATQETGAPGMKARKAADGSGLLPMVWAATFGLKLGEDLLEGLADFPAAIRAASSPPTRPRRRAADGLVWQRLVIPKQPVGGVGGWKRRKRPPGRDGASGWASSGAQTFQVGGCQLVWAWRWCSATRSAAMCQPQSPQVGAFS